MTVEHDEGFEPWPGEPDPINTALMPLIEHIFAATADGSVERGKARFNAQVEAELNKQIDAELQIELQAKRQEIARRLRREAVSREYDRINARHPIEGPGDPIQEAARVAAMRAGAARDAEHMARVNSRPIEGSLEHRRRASIGPGGEGFRIKG